MEYGQHYNSNKIVIRYLFKMVWPGRCTVKVKVTKLKPQLKGLMKEICIYV